MSDVDVHRDKVCLAPEVGERAAESAAAASKDCLDLAIDALERVMPDLPMLGALMLVLAGCIAACSGGSGATSPDADDPFANQQSADLARAVVPF